MGALYNTLGGDTGLKLNGNNVNFALLSIETLFPPVANIAVPPCGAFKGRPCVCPSHSNCDRCYVP